MDPSRFRQKEGAGCLCAGEIGSCSDSPIGPVGPRREPYLSGIAGHTVPRKGSATRSRGSPNELNIRHGRGLDAGCNIAFKTEQRPPIELEVVRVGEVRMACCHVDIAPEALECARIGERGRAGDRNQLVYGFAD